MAIGPSALMTTLMLPYLMLSLLKLLGRSWFRLDPTPPLPPSFEKSGFGIFMVGLDVMGASKQQETAYSSCSEKGVGRSEQVKADDGFD